MSLICSYVGRLRHADTSRLRVRHRDGLHVVGRHRPLRLPRFRRRRVGLSAAARGRADGALPRRQPSDARVCSDERASTPPPAANKNRQIAQVSGSGAKLCHRVSQQQDATHGYVERIRRRNRRHATKRKTAQQQRRNGLF